MRDVLNLLRRSGAVLLLALPAAGCVGYAYPPPPLVVETPPPVAYAQPQHYSLPADVLFAFDSATLRPQADAALSQTLAAIRQQIPRPVIRVEGNTDSIGSPAYNATLSLRRAQAVAQWLRGHGVPPQAITEQGNGARRPVAPNTTPSGQDDPRGRALNRRVDLIATAA